MSDAAQEDNTSHFTLEPNGLAARLVLAFMASAGVMYANVSPLIVSGLSGSGFSYESASFVYSANMYGSALGAFGIIALIRRLPWRRTAVLLIASLLVVDLMSIWLTDANALYACRFLHGLAGGASVGVAFSVIARTENPERTFAFLLVVQSGLAGFATALLTPLLDEAGVEIVWMSLMAFSLLVLLLIPLLDDYPQPSRAGADLPGELQRTAPAWRAPLSIIGLALVAIFLYQAAEMATFNFMIELGEHYALETGFIAQAVAIGQWLSAPAALMVVWWSTRTGRLLPAVLGISATMASVALLGVASGNAFLIANAAFGIAFAMTLPYLLGMASELDQSGQLAALGGFASKMGLATGPAIAGMIVGSDAFERVITFSLMAFVLAILAVLIPTRYLDRNDRSPRQSPAEA